jgi:hypothetical protein
VPIAIGYLLNDLGKIQPPPELAVLAPGDARSSPDRIRSDLYRNRQLHRCSHPRILTPARSVRVGSPT